MNARLPAKINLQMNQTIQLDLTDRVMFGNIEQDKINETFSDGRLLGILMDSLLISEFGNVSYRKDEFGKTLLSFETEDGFNYFIESRVLTSTGAKVVPSNMIGAGRKFNEDEWNEWVLDFHGFVITDIREFPKMTIKVVSVDDIINNPFVKPKAFEKLNS